MSRARDGLEEADQGANPTGEAVLARSRLGQQARQLTLPVGEHVVEDGAAKDVLAAEVVEQRGLANTHRIGDRLERRAREPPLRELTPRSRHDALADAELGFWIGDRLDHTVRVSLPLGRQSSSAG